MNTAQSSFGTRFKVGIFTILGLALVGAMTIFVNDRPFWWRPCQLVHINIEDAAGLKAKSPVTSRGLQIGYLESIELTETYVRLGICITAPVEVLPATRASIIGQGFLGDKLVELRPVKYVGPKPEETGGPNSSPQSRAWSLFPSAHAADRVPAEAAAERRRGGRDIPVEGDARDLDKLVGQVDGLVEQMTALTKDLKDAINPQELRRTMVQLNRTLENASRTLSPDGGLNTTAQRTLAKLEDAIEQLRDQMARVNRGEGSLGMVLNDPTYAEELRDAIRNVNRLLSQVGGVRFVVDVGAERLEAYDGARGWFRLGIYPQRDRYYLLGISVDPRGRRTVTETTTRVNGTTLPTTETTVIEQSGVLLTGMVGKVLWRRVDLSIGVLHNDATFSSTFYLGPTGREEMLQLRNDIYTQGQDRPVEDRISVRLKPFAGWEPARSIYFRAGLESIRKVNGQLALFYGAGIIFDDQDIKLLFALR